MSTDNFKWPSDLVAEFCEYAGMRIGKSQDIKQQIRLLMEDFKQSKTIPKKEYEILSFLHDNGLVIGRPIFRDIFIYNGYGFNSSEMLKLNIKIHSVMRNGDMNVFTIGDITNYGRISGFHIEIGLMIVEFEGNSRQCYLNLLHKVEDKVPVFKTFDGVDVFYNDTIYLLSIGNWLITHVSCHGKPFEGVVGHFKYFSTKEAAMKYIEENKPLLSVNDVMDFFRKHYEATKEYNPSHGTIRDGMVYLAKQKQNTK